MSNQYNLSGQLLTSSKVQKISSIFYRNYEEFNQPILYVSPRNYRTLKEEAIEFYKYRQLPEHMDKLELWTPVGKVEIEPSIYQSEDSATLVDDWNILHIYNIGYTEEDMKKCYNFECIKYRELHEGECMTREKYLEVVTQPVESTYKPLEYSHDDGTLVHDYSKEEAIKPDVFEWVPTHEKFLEDQIGKKSDNKGLKYDGGKPDLSIVPVVAIEQIAAALTFGANKYGRGNFEKGVDSHRFVAAALRHIYAYMEGEDIDKESGNKHLAHALASLTIILQCEKVGTLNDTRSKK